MAGLRGEFCCHQTKQILLPWKARSWGPERKLPSVGHLACQLLQAWSCRQAWVGVNAHSEPARLRGRELGSRSVCILLIRVAPGVL